MKKRYSIVLAAALTAIGPAAHAGIPVFDGANVAQSIQNIVAWGKQYTQMAQSYIKQANQLITLGKQLDNVQGIRGMASLVNNPLLRQYVPQEWGKTLKLMSEADAAFDGLKTKANAVRSAAKLLDIADTAIDPGSAVGKTFKGFADQAALNRTLAEESYDKASQRIADVQTLLDKVNDAPEQKDVMDLQARLQAETAMIANETAKLLAQQQAQAAQRDLADQQAREIAMKSVRMTGARGVF